MPGRPQGRPGPVLSTDPSPMWQASRSPSTIDPSLRASRGGGGDAVMDTVEYANTVRLVGRVSAPGAPRELPSGDTVHTLRVVVPRSAGAGRAGRAWTPSTSPAGPPAHGGPPPGSRSTTTSRWRGACGAASSVRPAASAAGTRSRRCGCGARRRRERSVASWHDRPARGVDGGPGGRSSR